MPTCYCLQFSVSSEESCELTYTDCEGMLVNETFSGGQHSICSQDLTPFSPCSEIQFFVNGLCENGECVGIPIKQRNECDPITIFPMGVQCMVIDPSDSKSYDGSATLSITGGTPPYTILWDIGSVSAAITNLGPGNYGATIIDYYGDFTANTICVLTGSTPSVTPTPTPSPTPTPVYADLCFSIELLFERINSIQNINFNYNGSFNGKPTWISDDTSYNVVWMSGTSQWEISGWTSGSIVNINPSVPPIIGWQAIGGLGTIQSIVVNEGSCSGNEELSYEITKNNPNCECDGSIIFNVIQGNSPYYYSINNGASYQDSPIFNNLCFGEYNTKVVDNSGFTKSEVVILSEPPATTNYTIELSLNSVTGNFYISVSPKLENNCNVSFDLKQVKTFDVSPSTSAATYLNFVTLNVDGSPVGSTSSSSVTTITPLLGLCSSKNNYNIVTTNVWSNLNMNSSTTINGTITNSIIPISPLVDCYNANGYYDLYLDNVQINDCGCSNILVINPVVNIT